MAKRKRKGLSGTASEHRANSLRSVQHARAMLKDANRPNASCESALWHTAQAIRSLGIATREAGHSSPGSFDLKSRRGKMKGRNAISNMEDHADKKFRDLMHKCGVSSSTKPGGRDSSRHAFAGARRKRRKR